MAELITGICVSDREKENGALQSKTKNKINHSSTVKVAVIYAEIYISMNQDTSRMMYNSV